MKSKKETKMKKVEIPESPVRPIADKLVVKRLDAETETAGGLIIPEMAQVRPLIGIVVAVGPGKNTNGKRIPLDVKIGDKVTFSKNAMSDLVVGTDSFYIIQEADISLVLSE